MHKSLPYAKKVPCKRGRDESHSAILRKVKNIKQTYRTHILQTRPPRFCSRRIILNQPTQHMEESNECQECGNHRAAHESWNRRDFQGLVKNVAEGLVYTDHARDLTLNNREKFREWTEDWAKAPSDGRITNPEYIDAGDIVIAQITARRHQRRTIRFTQAHWRPNVPSLL